MDTQIRAIRNDIENVQLLLIAIERQDGYNETNRLIRDVQDIIVKTERSMIQLNSQLSREPATVRQIQSLKVDQLKSDFVLIKNSQHAMKIRYNARQKQAKDKEELLTKRFTKNSETRVNLGLDHELNMNDNLKYSNTMIDQLLSQGASVYEDLQKQKNYLYNIQKRFYFLTKSLGISDTTVQLIDKRIREDRKLFMFGVISCLCFMISFYYWWH